MDTAKLDSIVLNALRLAARTFEADARNPAHPKRLREQFIEQARDALNACELIEVGVFAIYEQQSVADIVRKDPILCSAVSVSPSTGERVSSAPQPLRDTPADTGNIGGVSFTQLMLDTVHEWECANGFVHPIGVPCVGECAP